MNEQKVYNAIMKAATVIFVVALVIVFTLSLIL